MERIAFAGYKRIFKDENSHQGVWNKRFKEVLLKLHLPLSTADPCLFFPITPDCQSDLAKLECFGKLAKFIMTAGEVRCFLNIMIILLLYYSSEQMC